MNHKEKMRDDESGILNKGHRFGVLFQHDNYYFADAVRINEEGCIEFYCKHNTHSRLGKATTFGLVVDYNPAMSLDDFKKLPGQREG